MRSAARRRAPCHLLHGVMGGLPFPQAGLIQFRAEDRLHMSAPDRFPPGLLAFVREIIRRLRKGESLDDLFSDIKAEDALKEKQAQAARDVAPQSTAACATPEITPSCV